MDKRTALGVLAATLAVVAACLVAPSEAPAAKLGARTLKKGMRGPDVRALQRSLSLLAVKTAADGRFGNSTARNMRTLERRWGWRVDGKVQRGQGRLIRMRTSAKRLRLRTAAATSAYVFPVAGPHNFGSPAGAFGAPRSGHIHQGQDVMAACGTAIVAASSGTIRQRAYQGSGAGNYVVVHGVDGSDTMYAHFRRPSWTWAGLRISAGQQIGQVGHSGDASGCHLHFEHWTPPGWYAGGRPFDPLPELIAWDAYS